MQAVPETKCQYLDFLLMVIHILMHDNVAGVIRVGDKVAVII